jgi:hypothetical protein
VINKEVEHSSWGGAWHCNRRNLCSCFLKVNNLGKAVELKLTFSFSSAAGVVPDSALEYWVQLYLCPHRLLLLSSPQIMKYFRGSEHVQPWLDQPWQVVPWSHTLRKM